MVCPPGTGVPSTQARHCYALPLTAPPTLIPSHGTLRPVNMRSRSFSHIGLGAGPCIRAWGMGWAWGGAGSGAGMGRGMGIVQQHPSSPMMGQAPYEVPTRCDLVLPRGLTGLRAPEASGGVHLGDTVHEPAGYYTSGLARVRVWHNASGCFSVQSQLGCSPRPVHRGVLSGVGDT